MDKDSFLRDLLDRLTPAQKAGQLNLLSGAMDVTGPKHPENLERRIRDGLCGAVLNVYTAEETSRLQELALASPAGVPLLFGYDVIHGHRTIFPIPLGLACSWNLELITATARAAALEAAADGLHWVFSPMVDVTQDARWGRVAEGAGEDPWLGSKIAAAMVRGYQDPTLPHPVIACVKHLALYGATKAGRDYAGVDIGRREMEETHFPPYRAAVEAGVRTAMSSFNLVDGIPATGSRWLLTELLRERWKFTGWVVSDYTSIAEMKQHGTAADDADCARQAFQAGCDMDMMSEAYLDALPTLVAAGAVDPYQLDAAVMAVLSTKWDLGLFEKPLARCDDPPSTAIHLRPSHRELAREAAREAIVLLKNDAGLLPLTGSGTIALIGPLSGSARDLLGCWIAAGDAADAPTLRHAFEAAGTDYRILHASGCGIEAADPTLLDEALRAAAHADVVVLALGESAAMSGEASCRTDIRLPKCQRELAKRVAKTGKPCVVITFSGRPLDLSREAGRFGTLLHAWAPGTEGANAVADVVFGRCAPIGKLTMGFPRSTGQLPTTYREKPTGRPFQAGNPHTSRYLDCPNDALFPFGHGLTYGSFSLGPVSAAPAEMPAGGEVAVSADLTNTGPRTATETLQLYLRDPVASVSRPVMELRGFQRLTLAAGETRRVVFTLTDADLAFPGPEFEPVVEDGAFEVMIGPDSRQLQRAAFVRISRA